MFGLDPNISSVHESQDTRVKPEYDDTGAVKYLATRKLLGFA